LFSTRLSTIADSKFITMDDNFVFDSNYNIYSEQFIRVVIAIKQNYLLTRPWRSHLQHEKLLFFDKILLQKKYISLNWLIRNSATAFIPNRSKFLHSPINTFNCLSPKPVDFLSFCDTLPWCASSLRGLQSTII